jgi:hypothetical protein
MFFRSFLLRRPLGRISDLLYVNTAYGKAVDVWMVGLADSWECKQNFKRRWETEFGSCG